MNQQGRRSEVKWHVPPCVFPYIYLDRVERTGVQVEVKRMLTVKYGHGTEASVYIHGDGTENGSSRVADNLVSQNIHVHKQLRGDA